MRCIICCPAFRTITLERLTAGFAKSWTSGRSTITRPIATSPPSWLGWRGARWGAAPPRSFVQHDAELFVIRTGQDRAIELRWIRGRQVAEIVHDLARTLDGRVAFFDLAHRFPAKADLETAVCDKADHWNRMHVLRHLLAREEVDARRVHARNGL